MKVVIPIIDLAQEAGGGSTFEKQIFTAFLDIAHESNHDFILIGLNSESLKQITPASNVELIKIKTKKPTYYYLQRAYDKWCQPLIAIAVKRDSQPQPKRDLVREHSINYTLKQIDQIDILWNILPGRLTAEIPYIATVWDLQHRLQPYFPEVSSNGVWQVRERDKDILQRASYILTGTQAGKAEIERFYQIPNDRIKVVPLPTPNFPVEEGHLNKTQILEKYKLPENYLFYPAQFWPHKNHINLLLALQHLRDSCNLTLPIVFCGSEKGNYEYIRQKVIDFGLEKQVYSLGFVPRSDLVGLYLNAFALTFMSFFGPDNLPPLEAFSLGCPVIAAAVSGAEEQLGEAALLVNPAEPVSIAKTIKKLWDNDSLRQSLIQKGSVRAAHWTSQDYVRTVFSILDEFEAIRRCWGKTPILHF